jgi:DNA-binding NarL/FixJ family response regulator
LADLAFGTDLNAKAVKIHGLSVMAAPLPRRSRVAAGVTANRAKVMTRRNEQVLKLVAWGLTQKQISAKLGVSVKTIETHIARSKTLLRLRDRSDIVRYAVRLGWLRD